MRICRVSPLVLVLAAAPVGLAACTDGSSKPDTGPAAEAETGGPNGGDDGEDPGPLGAFTGVVVDSSGSPLHNVNAQLCREVCKLGRTEADGSFHIEADPGTWAFEVIVDPTDPASGWATPLAPVAIVDEMVRELPAPVVVPRLDAVVALTTSARVELGSGLWLDVVPAEWEAPVLTPDAEPWAGGVKVDPAGVGLPLDGIEGTVAGAWYLSPTSSHPQQPWALTFTNTFGWSAGESAEVWVADYGLQAWIPGGAAVVSADGTELVGAELSIFGTVLLMTPSTD